MEYLDYWKIVEENFYYLLCCVRDFEEDLIKIHLIRLFPKPWVKHSLEFSFFFLPLMSACVLENKVATYSINKHKYKLC